MPEFKSTGEIEGPHLDLLNLPVPFFGVQVCQEVYLSFEDFDFYGSGRVFQIGLDGQVDHLSSWVCLQPSCGVRARWLAGLP